jgi:hypothetical protein
MPLLVLSIRLVSFASLPSSSGITNRLADLNQVAVGVFEVAAKLQAAVLRRCQELRPAPGPAFINRINTRYPNV